jgi:PleD family two-component response regulator
MNTETTMRILVVDDSEDALDLTEGTLLSAGYKDVITASSATDALGILDVGRPTDEDSAFDLVLLDIAMPVMDGIEACARIRNDPRYVDLPIIMVTARDDTDSLANAFVAGATDYVTKPVNRIELVARARAALKLKAEFDRRQARERELHTFICNWGDRCATRWIDEATGLFVGEAAEAYLSAATKHQRDETISILALSLDRYDAYRSVHGEAASQRILAQVARALSRITESIGVIAAAYHNGTIILIAPEVDARSACELGETLRATVSKLRLPNSESVLSDHVTASVAAITGRVRRGIDRVQLLTQAVAKLQDAAGAGGNRVVALTI